LAMASILGFPVVVMVGAPGRSGDSGSGANECDYRDSGNNAPCVHHLNLLSGWFRRCGKLHHFTLSQLECIGFAELPLASVRIPCSA
jgi:hypothetical protein